MLRCLSRPVTSVFGVFLCEKGFIQKKIKLLYYLNKPAKCQSFFCRPAFSLQGNFLSFSVSKKSIFKAKVSYIQKPAFLLQSKTVFSRISRRILSRQNEKLIKNTSDIKTRSKNAIFCVLHFLTFENVNCWV